MPTQGREASWCFGPLRARCLECRKIFRPNARLKLRQKTCGEMACRRKARTRYQQKYRRINPGLEREYSEKRRRARSPEFWRHYRRDHPMSTRRNREAAKLRARLMREGLQRKLDIVEVIDPPGYFELFHEFATRHRSLIEELIGIPAA